jgi:sulfatase modifying factor 1
MFRRVVLFVIFLMLVGAGIAVYHYTKPPPGVLVVRTTPPGAQVWIDGALRGTTPDTGLVVAFEEAGSHHLVLERDGYERDTTTVMVSLDEVVELDLILQVPGMAFVRGGTFEMGTADGDYNERPAHKVELDPFYLDREEVSVGAFRLFQPTYQPVFPGDQNPATDISWDEAVSYCNWMRKRLPTEAEWERACRGVRGDTYSYGRSYDLGKGRTGLNLKDGPSRVGSYQAGNGGLFDMTGNVWEWCSDWYDRDHYSNSATRNPRGPAGGVQHVLRGGAWFSNAHYARCSHRPGNIGKERDSSFGFRCARDLD